MNAPPTFAVLDVLTRSGSARDSFITALDATIDTDAALVSDVLRATGRVGAALGTRSVLVQMCAVLRVLDAWQSGGIDVDELARGFAVHAARSDRFEQFGDARASLRTLDEMLTLARASARATTGMPPSSSERADSRRITSAHAAHERALHAQIAFLHADVRGWVLAELTGHSDGAFTTAETVAVEAVSDVSTRAVGTRIADELLTGSAFHNFHGLVAAAWRRGWAAVPVEGERLGDDHDECVRLLRALRTLGVGELLQIDLAPRVRWHVRGALVTLADGLRSVVVHSLDECGMSNACAERRSHALFTDLDGSSAYLESDDHHVIAGPRALVEAVCGRTPGDALATFRAYVETSADADGEPSADLLAVADRYGRLRRRGRAGS
ncbi:MAG: hypothetical protein JWN41_383 [Thermoleophilia bacterium]|nr:hypothetical protein [Thermoleophilia bacterium]